MRRDIPILVNARMSLSAFCAWQRMGHGSTFGGCFRSLSGSNRATADRLRTLGAKNVIALGNLKYSAAPLGFNPAKLEELRNDIGGFRLGSR